MILPCPDHATVKSSLQHGSFPAKGQPPVDVLKMSRAAYLSLFGPS